MVRNSGGLRHYTKPNVEARSPVQPDKLSGSYGVRKLACAMLKQAPALQIEACSYIFAASPLRYASVSLMLSRAVSDAPLSMHNGPL